MRRQRGGWSAGKVAPTGNPGVDHLIRVAMPIARTFNSFRAAPEKLLRCWSAQPFHWRHEWIDEACDITDLEWLRCAEQLSAGGRGHLYSLWMLIESTRHLRNDGPPPDWPQVIERAGQVFGLTVADVQHDLDAVMHLREEMRQHSLGRFEASRISQKRAAQADARKLVAALADDLADDDE
jgi:hypothetical protein